MMGSIFIDLIKKEYIIIYMDDILIFAEQKIYSRNTLGWPLILQWLWEHDLYLKPKKCEFKKEKIKYLGMIV